MQVDTKECNLLITCALFAKCTIIHVIEVLMAVSIYIQYHSFLRYDAVQCGIDTLGENLLPPSQTKNMGGSRFFQNVDSYLPNYPASCPRIPSVQHINNEM